MSSDKYEAIKNRRGKFVVGQELLESDPDSVMAAMGKCIVMRAEYLYEVRSFEYFALSPEFDDRLLGQETPLYTILVRYTQAGSTVEFARIR